jgi:hypothetical protein
MAVCTNELTFHQLSSEGPSKAASEKGADLRNLLRPWQVIPFHRCVMEVPSAIRTWTGALQAAIPLRELLAPASRLLKP